MTDPAAPEDRVLRLERTFAAPARAVFDAWTSAEVLRRWWLAGADWETPVAEVDVRVGGGLRLVMRSPGGEDFGGCGEYLEVIAPGRLVLPGPGMVMRGTKAVSLSRSTSGSVKTAPRPWC